KRAKPHPSRPERAGSHTRNQSRRRLQARGEPQRLAGGDERRGARAGQAHRQTVFDLVVTTMYDGDAVNGPFSPPRAARGARGGPAGVNTAMGLAKPEAFRMFLDQFGQPRRQAPFSGQLEAFHEGFTGRMCDYDADDPTSTEVP